MTEAYPRIVLFSERQGMIASLLAFGGGESLPERKRPSPAWSAPRATMVQRAFSDLCHLS